MRRTVDLSSHLNHSVARGNQADFAVHLEPLLHGDVGSPKEVKRRKAIVREDTGDCIAVVGDRYVLVPHQRILDVVEEAIVPLDLGEVPRGIYLEAHGARMRALYKFPILAEPVVGKDDICPCLQVRNTYDGTSRIALHIGAFRFVCTNLSVGGGGAFAGGFLSIHQGEIPIEEIGKLLSSYLTHFKVIVSLYREWTGMTPRREEVEAVLAFVLRGRFEDLEGEVLGNLPPTVFEVYNRLTFYATHKMRSARTAFDMLERVNQAFQKVFSVNKVHLSVPELVT